jgi:uncharacterized RDD family membrane protein YckC
LVLLGLVVAAGLLLGLAVEAFPNASAPSMRFLAEFAVVGLLLFTTVSEIVFATSPGKSIYGLTIAQASGNRASRRRLSLRWAVKYAPLLLVLAAAGIDHFASRFASGIYWSSFSYQWPGRIIVTLARAWAWAVVAGFLLTAHPARRTLHDFLAGTAVFDVARLACHDEPVARGFEVAHVSPTPLPVTSLDMPNPPPLPDGASDSHP